MTNVVKWFYVMLVLCLSLAGQAAATGQKAANNESDWPEITAQCRPWSYWWWMGSAVDEANLKYRLKEYQQAGMGGLHIIPIYGVKGYEDKFIDFLNPKWMSMLTYTVEQANQLGLGIDMSTGTGWPFGGAMVGDQDAACKAIIKSYTLSAGGNLAEPLTDGQLMSLMGYSDKGTIINLLDKVKEGRLAWTAPDGNWKLYAIFQNPTGQNVKRAAPGAEGKVLDPFSTDSMGKYLVSFDKAFGNYKRDQLPRAQYHDSYEYYRADWTDTLLDEFLQKRGYDLRDYMPAFFSETDPDEANRVKCDYKETISDLHLEFVEKWVKWSRDRGFITRNEAHGSPTNILDVYAASDIPETETFGPFDLPIPGLRIDADFNMDRPDVLMIKFASSAAHVAGMGLTASESCTWLTEHFKAALSQAKAQIDQIFIGGVNHLFYHGSTYSPTEEAFPGWLFYAMTNFSPANNCIWHDIDAMNNYISRCQSVLQAGKAANDILLYFPIHDLWHNQSETLDRAGCGVHNTGQWLKGRTIYDVALMMWKRGFTFDYISDRQIAKLTTTNNAIISSNGTAYKTIIVPGCKLMPAATMEKLATLAEEGATVIFVPGLPDDVPGWGNLQQRRDIFAKAKTSAQKNTGKGSVLIGDNAEKMLTAAKIHRVSSVDYGVEFIRRGTSDGYYYFMTNSSAKPLADWIDLGVSCRTVVIMDPLNENRFGQAALKQTDDTLAKVYLQLEPGRSCVLHCLDEAKPNCPRWKYYQVQSENGSDVVTIEGKWQVTFVAGGPELPENCQIDTLGSWTDFGGEQAKHFGGTARYRINFNKPKAKADEWLLDLGTVCESARVFVNGRYVETLFSIPFKVAIGDYLCDGQNTLELEVTNLAANRIADLDRRKVDWKKFYDTNFINIQYKPFDASNWPLMDSGLLGPVRLIPLIQTTSPTQ